MLHLGFRPFHLGGGLFGVVAIVLADRAAWPPRHRLFACYERCDLARLRNMVFGFVAAIVVGFQLTAVQIANYWLMIAAATVLVYGPWAANGATAVCLDVTGQCWSAALIAYLMQYAPSLTASRIDGKAD